MSGLRIASVLAATCLARLLPAQAPVELRTAQTSVRIEATASAPRLVSVTAPRAEAWENQGTDALIGSAVVAGKTVVLEWHVVAGAGRRDAKTVAFVYETSAVSGASAPHLRLTWEWTAAAGTGPIEHRVHIENLGAGEVWIPVQESLRFRFPVEARAALSQLYVDKGAGRPSAEGTHRRAVDVGYRWEGVSSTYAIDDGPREVIPWFSVERGGVEEDGGNGWYVGVEFSGRTSLTLAREGGSIHGVVGLNGEPGPFMTRIEAGGTFEAPPIFLGAFEGGRDGLGNVLRPWVRQVLNNPVTWADPHYPLLVNNSWGSGMAVDEALSKRMIADSAELGLEMFGLDAGWFRGVGDWYPDPKKFPNGLAPLTDEAHRRGLKFGMWVDWAQAGVDRAAGALNVQDEGTKRWMVADVPEGWAPDAFVGRTIDLGVPAAKEYAEGEVKRIVSSYKLDMLEHDGYLVAHACARTDHPHAAPPAGYGAGVKGSGVALALASNSTDVSYHAVRAYYDIYARLRKEHPELLLEICNDGGRMVDFGSAAHGDYFSITDTYDPLSNRRAFYDASQVLPAAMLEDYVERWPTPSLGSFRYMLRSGMMGWLTIMQDTNAWTPEQHAAAKAEFALYKSDLRPLIRDADLYHVSERPDGVHWDGMEYFDRRRGRGVVYAFRGTTTDEPDHVFRVKGVDPGRRYRVHFQDGTSAARTIAGRELLRAGITVHLQQPNSSELILFEEAGALAGGVR